MAERKKAGSFLKEAIATGTGVILVAVRFDELGDTASVGIRDRDRTQLGHDLTEEEEAIPRRLKASRDDPVGGFELIRKRMVHQNSHADLVLVNPTTESFEIRIEVVEAGVNFSHGPENATFVFLGGITVRRTVFIAIEIVLQTAAIAIVKSGSDELIGILNVGGAPESEFFQGVESRSLKRGDDADFMTFREISVILDEVTDSLEIGIENSDVRWPGMGRKSGCYGLT